MSTRAFVIIKDETSQVQFYRHSDGYPECTGESLKEFVEQYKSGLIRCDVMQSSGWLVIKGHSEYLDGKVFTGKPTSERYSGWKVGAYEPCDPLIPSDVEYIYIIDLTKLELSCRNPNSKFWDNPTIKNTTLSKKFKTVSFAQDKSELSVDNE